MIVCNSFQETGWVPQHIVAEDDSNNVLGVIPLYLKRFVNLLLIFIHCGKGKLHGFCNSCLCNCASLLLHFMCVDVVLYLAAAILTVNMSSTIHGQMPIIVVEQDIIQSCNVVCLSLLLLVQGS